MKKTDEQILRELWEKISKLRKTKNMTQSFLWKKTWIDRSYISMVERWETNITYLKLLKIFEALEVQFEGKFTNESS